jgi:hypothetical protein
MVSKRSWKAWAVLGVAVAVFVTSGGLLMASNMGFKINKQLSNGNVVGSNKGVTWTSFPYINPYNTFRGACKAIVDTPGFVFTVPNIATVNVEEILISHNAPGFVTNGNARNQNCATCCGTAACITAGGVCSLNLVQNNVVAGPISDFVGLAGGPSSFRYRITGAGPTSVILVGSSNETQNTAKLIPNATDTPVPTGFFSVLGTNKSHNWINIPYHTTWLDADDACTSLGVIQAVAPNPAIPAEVAKAINVARIDLAGNTNSFSCGSQIPNANNFAIEIGQGLRVRDTSTPNNLPGGATGGILVPHY